MASVFCIDPDGMKNAWTTKVLTTSARARAMTTSTGNSRQRGRRRAGGVGRFGLADGVGPAGGVGPPDGVGRLPRAARCAPGGLVPGPPAPVLGIPVPE